MLNAHLLTMLMGTGIVCGSNLGAPYVGESSMQVEREVQEREKQDGKRGRRPPLLHTGLPFFTSRAL